MTIRSVIMTVVLVALVALVIIGRLRRHPRRYGHPHTTSLLQRIEGSVKSFERLERRELRLGRGTGSGAATASGHLAPRGNSPHSA